MAEAKQDELDTIPNCSNWRFWCRLCAKDDPQGNINVFLKNEQNTHSEQLGEDNGVTDLSLATAIGKYFWVNITRHEELPEMICSECLALVTSLVNFSERITRVQKLYCMLQSSPKDSLNVLELRAKFGLLDEPEIEGLETLTEVHYVEEKPKLHELEEATLELANPLTPCAQNVDKYESNEGKMFKAAAEQEEETSKEEEEEEEDDLQLHLCEDAFSNDDSNASSAESINKKCKKVKFFQCSDCPRSYALAQTLQRHVRQAHGKSGKDIILLNCDHCSKMFRSNYLLQRHKQKHLPILKRQLYPCGSCNKKFTSLASAQAHGQYMHQEERPRPVMCEQCGIAVHSMNALKEHLLSHTDYAPFECEECKKCFKSLSRLKHHKETHDPHKYICPECGMQLNSRPTLNRHRLVHTDQMQHKCDYCGREFKRAKALKNHLILHTGLKPYSCDFCDRTFANGSNCRTHKKKAHPEELAAQEAAGGAKSYNRNIPKLEALKAFTKNKDNLSPVATKQSGCFAFGKKPKKTESLAMSDSNLNPNSNVSAQQMLESGIPTIETIYSHIMKQTPETPTTTTTAIATATTAVQQQLLISSDGSANILATSVQDQLAPSSVETQMFIPLQREL